MLENILTAFVLVVIKGFKRRLEMVIEMRDEYIEPFLYYYAYSKFNFDIKVSNINSVKIKFIDQNPCMISFDRPCKLRQAIFT